GLDVPQRELDARDRLRGDAAGALAGHAVHVLVSHLDRARILADQDRGEVTDGRDDAVWIAAVGTLAVARDPRIGAHGDELPRAPSRVHDEGVEPRDFHAPLPQKPSRTSLPITCPASSSACARLRFA